jgi:hypothetical protein
MKRDAEMRLVPGLHGLSTSVESQSLQAESGSPRSNAAVGHLGKRSPLVASPRSPADAPENGSETTVLFGSASLEGAWAATDERAFSETLTVKLQLLEDAKPKPLQPDPETLSTGPTSMNSEHASHALSLGSQLGSGTQLPVMDNDSHSYGSHEFSHTKDAHGVDAISVILVSSSNSAASSRCNSPRTDQVVASFPAHVDEPEFFVVGLPPPASNAVRSAINSPKPTSASIDLVDPDSIETSREENVGAEPGLLMEELAALNACQSGFPPQFVSTPLSHELHPFSRVS